MNNYISINKKGKIKYKKFTDNREKKTRKDYYEYCNSFMEKFPKELRDKFEPYLKLEK